MHFARIRNISWVCMGCVIIDNRIFNYGLGHINDTRRQERYSKQYEVIGFDIWYFDGRAVDIKPGLWW